MGALPAQLSDTLGAHYGITPFDAKPLPGGWDRHAESWLVRSELGVLVVRADRSLTLASADWLGEVLEAARRRGVPVSAPLRTRDGAAGAALRDAAVTVRRYIEGRRVDRDRLEEAATAATVLARSHEALRGFDRPRPDRSLWHPVLWPAGNDPEPLRDLALDSFEAAFAADSRFADTVIHGDYWADNLIWSETGLAAVIDWSEARHDKAVRELARATWEFGHTAGEDELDIDRARAFLAAYREAADGLEPDVAEVLMPLMRYELRLDARFAYWQSERDDDMAEREYGDGLARAFRNLRLLDPALLLH